MGHAESKREAVAPRAFIQRIAGVGDGHGFKFNFAVGANRGEHQVLLPLFEFSFEFEVPILVAWNFDSADDQRPIFTGVRSFDDGVVARAIANVFDIEPGMIIFKRETRDFFVVGAVNHRQPGGLGRRNEKSSGGTQTVNPVAE